MHTRRQLRQEAALTEADLKEIRQCRRPHNRLGFAYQLSFVRLLNRLFGPIDTGSRSCLLEDPDYLEAGPLGEGLQIALLTRAGLIRG